jgi:hypothetical protein
MQHYLNQPSIPQKEGREATDYGFRYPPPLVREAKIPTHFQGLCAHYSSNQLADNDLEFIMRRTPGEFKSLLFYEPIREYEVAEYGYEQTKNP